MEKKLSDKELKTIIANHLNLDIDNTDIQFYMTVTQVEKGIAQVETEAVVTTKE